MRELNTQEVLEVSGAGVIADSLAQVGSQVGSAIDKTFKTNTSTTAMADVGRNIGTAVETTLTNLATAGQNLVNNFFKWLKIA